MYSTRVLLICFGLFTSTGAEPSGLLITCGATKAYMGERGTVVCNYRTDLTDIGTVYISVDHYKQGSNEPEEVAACTNVNSEGLRCQDNRNGYTFRLTEKTGIMVLEIGETAEDHAGRYVCKLMAPSVERTHTQPCILSVQARNVVVTTRNIPETEITDYRDDSSSSLTSHLGFLVGLPVAIIVLVVGIIVVFILLRRRVKSKHSKRSHLESGENDKTSTGLECTFQDSCEKTGPPFCETSSVNEEQSESRQPLLFEPENNSRETMVQSSPSLPRDTGNRERLMLEAASSPEETQHEGLEASSDAGKKGDDHDAIAYVHSTSPTSGLGEHMDELIEKGILVETPAMQCISPRTLEQARKQLRHKSFKYPS